MNPNNYSTRTASLFNRWMVLTFIVLGTLATTTVNAQVSLTATTGTPGGSYTTLKGAFDAINAGTHNGVINISITANTTETAIAALNASGSGSASYTSVTISPSGGAARTISGSLASELVHLNGADNVTIDGLNSGGNTLTIENTSTASTSGTSTIRFSSDATGNTVTRCNVLSSSTAGFTSNGGAIWFSTAATGGTGNDNNIISNNNFGPSGVNLPVKYIVSAGTTTAPSNYNSGNQINNNNFYDYFSATVAHGAIYIGSGGTNWTIDGNKFFQTAARTITTASTHTVIQFASTNNEGNVIKNNIIGYSSSSGTGTYTVSSTAAANTSNAFRAILLTVGTTTVTELYDNTITAISYSGNNNGTGASSIFLGVYVTSTGGLINFGTASRGNIIGGTTSATHINITNTGTSNSEVYAFYNFGSQACTVQNSSIGGITYTSSSTSTSTGNGFYGIRINTAATVAGNIINNTIGYPSAPLTMNNSAGTVQILWGIRNDVSIGTITGNVVRNLTSNVANTTGGATAGVQGIYSTSSVLNNVISNNQVFSIGTTAASAAVTVIGINLSGVTTGNNSVVSRNLVHSLTSTSSSATSSIVGINCHAGNFLVNNNMVRLGLDAAGNTTGNGTIFGINEAAAAVSLTTVHNTVYIGGNIATGAAATSAYRSVSTATTGRSIINNILFNARNNTTGTGKHYAISLNNATGVTSNYNILRATGSGAYTGLNSTTPADFATLANWQASGLGTDANSLDGDPCLVNPTAGTPDLHLTNCSGAGSPANAAGTASSTTTADYDNETRASLTPVDIGADAGLYGAAGKDITFSTVTRPTAITCHSAAEDVQVSITNGGTINLDFSTDSVEVIVNVSGTVTNSFTVWVNSGTLNVGASQTVTLGQINTTANGAYSFFTDLNMAGDVNTANDTGTVNVNINYTLPSVTAVSSKSSICVSGNTNLTATPSNGTSPYTYVWSPGGATTNPATVAVTSTTAYTVTMTDACGVTATAATGTVTLDSPTITSSIPATRCGTGSVTLQATSSGTDVKWYAEATGGSSLGSGTSFNTPVISQTDTFYAAAIGSGISGSGARTAPTGTSTTTAATYGLVFDAAIDFTINTVDIYGATAGTMTVVLQNSAGTVLQTVSGIAVSGLGLTTPQAITLNIPVSAGTGYRLLATTSPALVRESSLGGFPYSLGSFGSITNGYISGTSTTYYYFYNWQMSSLCENPTRTPVIATITTPPSVSITGPTSYCSGTGAINLVASSSNDPNYVYTWTTGPTVNDSLTVTPTTTTTYTVNAEDTTTASANFGCATFATRTVTFNQTPSALTVTPAADTVCEGASTTLTASGGTISALGQVGTATTTSTTNQSGPLPVFWENVRQQVLITAAELTAAGLTAGPITSLAFNATAIGTLTFNWQNYTLKMGHSSATSLNTTFETSTLNTVYGPTTIPAASITTGWNTLTLTTPFVWNGTSNLLMELCFTNDASASCASCYNGSGSITYQFTATTGNMLHYLAADDASQCAVASGGTATTTRPNYRFGSVTPTTLAWSPGGQTTAAVTVAPTTATTYTVTATATNGCSTSTTAAVSVSPTMTANCTVDNNATCFGGTNGQASVSVSGGLAPYSYAWSPSGGTGATASGLAAGSYTVTVTDAAGCTASCSVTITSPSAITFTATPSNVTCVGGADGSIAVTAEAGGNGGPWEYSYNNGGSFSASNSSTGLTAGTYQVIVKDAAGCLSAASATVVGTTPVVYTVTASAGAGGTISPNGVVNVDCGTNQAFTITADPCYVIADVLVDGVSVGAVSSYTFTNVTANHTISASFAIITYSITATASTGGSIAPSGATTVNCGSDQSYTITPDPLYSIDSVVVNGVNQGALASYTFTNVQANGTIAAYFSSCTTPPTATAPATALICAGNTYTLSGSFANAGYALWSTSGTGTFDNDTVGVATTYTPSVADITAGTVTLTITTEDPAGACIAATASTVLTISFASVSISGDLSICTGESSTLTANPSPAGTYTYLWSTTATTAAISVNTGGSYTVIVTNTNGCTATANVTVVENTPPAPPTITPSGATTFCAGGSVDLTSSYTGGNTWNPGGATTDAITVTASGSYTVTYTDGNGCSATSAATVVTVNNASASISGVLGICTGGSTTLTASATPAAVSYLWSPGGETTAAISVNAAGVYTVTTTDANGCTATASATVINAGGFTVSVTSDCPTWVFGNPNTLTATPSVAGTYTYSWGGGGTTNTRAISDTGTYVVTVTDAFGCTATGSYTLTASPLNGAYTIGGTACGEFSSLNNAVRHFNRGGVSGNVTWNVPAGYSEVAPAGGFQLSTCGLASGLKTGPAQTLTIQKSGAGANPVLGAPVGTSTTLDGIFTIIGADNISINGINLQEAAANTTATQQMEWGYGVLKCNVDDGCNDISIQNCLVRLTRSNTASKGIYASNHTIASTTLLTTGMSTTPGSEQPSRNKVNFSNNTVKNCYIGISATGNSANATTGSGQSLNDTLCVYNNNTIDSIGGSTIAAYGIILSGVRNYVINGNAITNLFGTSTLNGINGGNGPWATISNNTVNFTNSNFTTTTPTGITVGSSGGNAANPNLTYVFNNSVTGNNTTATSAGLTGMSGGGSGTGSKLFWYNNTVQNIALSGTGALVGQAPTGADSVTFYNNVVNNLTKTGASGTLTGFQTNGIAIVARVYGNSITNIGLTASSGTTSSTVSGLLFNSVQNLLDSANTVNNVYLLGASTATANVVNGIRDQSNSIFTLSKIHRNNSVTNVYSAVAASLSGFYSTVGSQTVRDNTFTTIRSTLVSGSAVIVTARGIRSESSTASSTTNIFNNTISGVRSTGTGTSDGIFNSVSTTTTVGNIYNNTISGDTANGGAACRGIVWNAGVTGTIYNNKVHSLVGQATGSIVSGIEAIAGTTVTFHNNIIGSFSNSFATGSNSHIGLNITGGTTMNAFFNTIYLAGSAGAGSGSSGISASTTPNLTLRNNIVVNKFIPNGAGLTVAYRRSSATLTSYQAASNKNIFFAGTPSASQLIYSDGAGGNDQTIAAFKTRMATRDQQSQTEDVAFASLVGANANFLHIPAATSSLAESGADAIAGITTDFDGDTRNTITPDIGADEFSGTTPAPTFASASYTPSGIQCVGTARNVTAVVNYGGAAPIGPLATATLNYAFNGVAQPPVVMSVMDMFPIGSQATLSGTIPAAVPSNATVTWSITASDFAGYTISYAGTSYSDDPLFGYVLSATTNAVNVCPASPANLSATLGIPFSVTNKALTSNVATLTTSVDHNIMPGAIVTVSGVDATFNGTYTVSAVSANNTFSYAKTAANVTSVAVAPPGTVLVNNPVNTYTVSSVAHSVIPTPGTGVTTLSAVAPTSGTTDDGYWTITLPFAFNFWGVNYTNASIGTNANVQFGALSTGGYGNAFPSTIAPNGVFAAIFGDMNTNVGTVNYFVDGVAPNRILVINWNAINWYNATPAVTAQAKLYEGTNILETHITSATLGNAFVVGVENQRGLAAVTAPGSNNTTRVATNEAWRFTPVGAGPAGYVWSDGTTNIGTGLSVTVNPTATTTYTVTGTDLNGCTVTDTVNVNVYPIVTAPTATNSAQCGVGIPAASVASTSGRPVPVFRWYDAPAGGTLLQQNVSTTYLAAVSVTDTFYVAEWDSICDGPRTMVIVNVSQPDAVEATVDDNVTCPLQTITLTASNLNPTPSNLYTYQWFVNGGTTAFSTGSPVNAAPFAPGTYVYSVQATDGLCATSSTVSVTVQNPPTITSITASPSTICLGDSTTLTATTPTPVPGSVTVGTATTSNTSTAYPSVYGSFWGGARTQFVLRASELIAAGLQPGNITAITFDVAAMNAGDTLRDFSISLKLSTDSTLSALDNTGFTTVYSSPGLTHKPVVGLNTYTFSTPFAWNGTSPIKFSVCFNNLDGGDASHPSVKFTATSYNSVIYFRNDNDPNICTSTTVTGTSPNRPNVILAGTVIGPGAGTYAWSWSDGISTIGSTNTLSVTPSATTIYTVTATDGVTGCTNSGTVIVTANPVPSAPVATNSSQCGSSVPTAYVTGSDPTGLSTYKWYTVATGGTPLAGETDSLLQSWIVTATDTFWVSEVYTGSPACEGPRAMVIVDVTIPDPIAITNSPAPYCVGSPISLSVANTASSPVNTYTYSWSASSTNAGISGSGSTATATPTATGTYTYTATGVDGLCQSVAYFTATVNDNPLITHISASPSGAVCAGSPVNLLAASVPSGSGTAQIGSGTTTSTTAGLPIFSIFWETTRVQYLFTAAELTAAGMVPGAITSLANNITALGSLTTAWQNYTIKMGHSSATSLTTTFETSATTTVYGPLTLPTSAVTAGWSTINFTTPFVWNGTSNIVVDVCFTNDPSGTCTGCYNPSSSITFETSTTAASMAHFANSDNTNNCGTAGPTGTATTIRPNFRFGAQVGVVLSNSLTWSWTPGGYTNDTITVNPLDTTTYVVTATNASGCTSMDSITVNTYDLPTPPTAVDNTICGYGFANVSVVSTTTNPTPAFRWYTVATGGSPIGGQSGSSLSSYPVSVTDTFWVSEFNPNCESSRTMVIQTVTQPDAIDATASADTVCVGYPVTLNVTNTGSTNTYSYNWTATPPVGSGISGIVLGPAATWYSSDFSSAVSGIASISGNASVTGGVLQLHPDALSQLGALQINNPGISADSLNVTFDMRVTPAGGADGMSYSFSDDGVPTVQAAMNAENGTGTKLKLAFVSYGSGLAGIYLMYNCVVNEQTSASPGVLAYVADTSWKNTVSPVTVNLSVSTAGLATVSLNGTPVVGMSNIALPAAYVTSNKSTWKHIFKGRSGGISSSNVIDNLNIQYAQYGSTPQPGSSLVVTPTAAGSYNYTAIGTDGSCNAIDVVTVVVVDQPASVDAGSDQTICSGASVTLNASSASFIPTLRFTEIAIQMTLVGSTSTNGGYNGVLPSWFPAAGSASSGNDLIEITNLGVAPTSPVGITFEQWLSGGTTPAQTLTVPAGAAMMPSGSSLFIQWGGIGNVVTDLVNNYYTTGISNYDTYSSSIAYGYIIKKNGVIIDAVASNTFTWPAAAGVTASDWSGNVASNSGRAAQVLISNDNNTASCWAPTGFGTSVLTSYGTLNPGVTANLPSLGTVSWTSIPAGFTASTANATFGPVTANTQFVVSSDNGFCAQTDTVTVNVFTTPNQPTVSATGGDTLCFTGSRTYTITNPQNGVTYQWQSSTDGTTWTNLAGEDSTVYATPSYNPTNDSTMYFRVYVSCGLNGDTSLVKTLFIARPTVAIYSGDTRCGAGPVTLTASGNGTMEWYDLITGGTLQATGSPFTPNVTGNALFYVGAAIGECRTPRATVTVNVTPSAVISLSATPSTICQGQTSTLVASNTGLPYSYVWSSTPAGTYSSDSTQIVTPSVTTSYTVVGTSGICSDIRVVNVVVNEIPVVSVTPTADTICQGESTVLTAAGNTFTPVNAVIGTGTGTTSTSGQLPYEVFWEGQRKQILVLASELTAAGAQAGNISSMTFSGIVLGATTIAQNAYTIKMASTATSNLTGYVAGTFTTVFGPTNYTPVNGNNTHSFSTPFYWDGVSNVVIDICSDNDPAGTCTGGSGVCYGSSPTNPFSTTAFTSVYGNYGDASAPRDQCNTPTGSLASGTSRPNFTLLVQPAVTYSWSPSGGTTTVATVSPVTTTVYTVTATTGTGCTSSATATVMVNPFTAPTITPSGPTTFCQPGTVDLDAGSGYASYSWSNGATTQVITVNASGTYIVTATAANGCSGTASIVVTVNPFTSPVISSNVPSICEGVDFATLSLNATYNSYLWSPGGETTSSITVGFGGTYSVTVTSANGCSGTASYVLSGSLAPLTPVILLPSTADTIYHCWDGVTADNITFFADVQFEPNTVWNDPANTSGDFLVITVGTGVGEYAPGSHLVTITSIGPGGCTAIDSVRLIISTNPVPVITPSATSVCVDSLVTLDAGAGYAAYSWSDGTTEVGTSQVLSANPSATTTYTVTVTNAEGCTGSATQEITTTTCGGGGVALDLTMFIQGYYLSPNSMQAVLLNQFVPGATGLETDSIFVELRDSLDPTILIDTATGVLMTDGTASLNFTVATSGTSYWIVVNHRTSVQTWSELPVAFSGSTTYNFTDMATKAYGSNMFEVEPGVWAMFTGDLDRDGYVTPFDFPLYELDNFNLVGEVYVNTDMDGDGYVTPFDFPIYELNNFNLVGVLNP